MRIRKNKSNSFVKKAIVGATVATTLGLGFWASKAFYTVASVIDGDTFITSENRYVRLDRGIDAPEIDRCLGKESKVELSKLVLGEKVFVKANYVDDRKRLIGSVYTINGDVGVAMLTAGLASYDNVGSSDKNNDYLEASRLARQKRVGIYSSHCTQTQNPENSKCNIKGNVNDNGKHYSLPECPSYGQSVVQLHFGDQWFCTEAEAKKAGFAKGGDCK